MILGALPTLDLDGSGAHFLAKPYDSTLPNGGR